MGINIGLGSKVTAIPLLGSNSPTFQYVGGSNASISMSLKTTKESAIQKVVAMEKLWRSQNNRMRALPLKLRRIGISNDFLNMCGLHNFLLDNISISTSPGEPECRYIHLNLTEKEFDGSDEALTFESFGRQFDNKYIKVLHKIFSESLRFIPGIFSEAVFGEKIETSGRLRALAKNGGKSRLWRQQRGGGSVQVGGDKGEELFVEEYSTMGVWGESHKGIDFGTNNDFLALTFTGARYKYGLKSDSLFADTFQWKKYDRVYFSSKEEMQNKAESIYRDLLLEYTVIYSDFMRGLLNYLQVTQFQFGVNLASIKRLVSPVDLGSSYRIVDNKNQLSSELRLPGVGFATPGYARKIVEWEYKRWKFIKELTEDTFPGISIARKDSFDLILRKRDDSSYFSNLLKGRAVVSNVDQNKRGSRESIDLSTTEYDEDEMWKDFGTQLFALRWAVQRGRFFKKMLENKDYLRVIAETEPDVKKLLEDMGGELTEAGTNAYPDFPIPEIIELISQNYEPQFENLKDNLKDLNVLMKRGKFISVPRLIGPDFYLESDPAPLDKLIGQNKLKNAIDVVKKSEEGREKSYNTWIDTLYKKQLGSEK